MTSSDWVVIAAALAPVLLGAVGVVAAWTLRAYTRSITDAIEAVGKDVARLEGRLHSLEDSLAKTVNQLTRVSAELTAVWRFVDGAAAERASDVFTSGRR